MTDNLKAKRRDSTLISWRKSIMFGVCIGVLSAALSVSPTGHWIDQTLFSEWAFKIRGVRAPPKGVLIVNMDERGADLPAATRGGRLWSRFLYASLIDRLSAAQASVIVVDVSFEEAGDKEGDKALVESLIRNNRVVLFQKLKRTEEGDVPAGPLPRFASAVPIQAVFPLPKHSRVDGYWPFFPAKDKTIGHNEYRDLPSLPVAALQVHLLREIGTGPFERLLGVESHSVKDANNLAGGDASVLISALRDNFLNDHVSEREIEDLVPDQLGGSSTIETMLHSLLDVYARRGLLPLNFYGPARTIQTLDHMSVINGGIEEFEFLHEAVSGKVVFIGHSSRSAVDQIDGFRTVYTQDGLDLSGVEIAATAYANLADGTVLRSTSMLLTITIHILLSMVCTFFVFRIKLLRAVACITAIVLTYSIFSLLMFSYAFRLLPLGMPILVLLPFTLFSLLFIRYFGIKRLIEIYRDGFGKLHPSNVWDDIAAGGPEHTVSKHLHGTCMITDIENFTHYAELLGHERATSLSQEYFSLITERVTTSGGELFDVDGDSITAFWERTSVVVESEQTAATDAAVEIMQQVTLFNQRHPDSPFVTRIGLDDGWVEASYIGGGGNYRYCLVGDVANTSSRLEGLNKRLGTSLLASRAVVSEVNTLLLRPVGVFLLKGKSMPLDVIEILGHRTSVTANDQYFCVRFAEALNQIAKGHLNVAEKNLTDILLTYGTDGPSGFYLKLITGHGLPDELLCENGIVKLDGK